MKIFLAAVACSASAVSATEITLPPETARLVESPLTGYGLATAHCHTCHSVDYITMQPVMPRAAWKGSVTKMQKVFGAPIPDEAVEPIAEYLAKTYGAERSTTTGGNRGSPTAAENNAGK